MKGEGSNRGILSETQPEAKECSREKVAGLRNALGERKQFKKDFFRRRAGKRGGEA